MGHLLWLADTRSLERKATAERLRHFRVALLPRTQGPPRLIEKPKRALKTIERRILHEILDVTYSRYADDLAFSGTHAGIRAVRRTARAVVEDAGFALNEHKQALNTQAGRQRVTGIVVNVHPAVERRERDRLRAALHQAPPDARLAGRRAWVTHVRAEHAARVDPPA